MHRHKKRPDLQRGQSLVEFAVFLVILLLLVAGIVDLGRVFFAYIALRDAAQEGAVYGSICPTDTAAIINRVRSSSSAPVDLTDSAHVQVQCFFVVGGSDIACGGSPTAGNGVKVRVTYNNFPVTMPFMGAILGTQTLTLHAEVQDTILRDECQ
jgi:Flp pilus assembly protein TadG